MEIPPHSLGYGYEHYKKYSGRWVGPLLLWWSDPKKKKDLEEAKKIDSIMLPIEDEVLDYWNMVKK